MISRSGKNQMSANLLGNGRRPGCLLTVQQHKRVRARLERRHRE